MKLIRAVDQSTQRETSDTPRNTGKTVSNFALIHTKNRSRIPIRRLSPEKTEGAAPDAHGAPVHIGSPSQIGIDDISKPEYGAPIEVRDTDIPVFWACGLTPFAALAAAAPPFCITHGPAAMLITDLRLLDCAVS